MLPSGLTVLENEPLSKYTSYRIGGPAKYFFLPKSWEDIPAIGAFIKKENLPYFVLGNGSNVLAPDEGFAGAVICTREFETQIDFLPDNQVRMGAGVLNARALRACAERGLGGIDTLSGVPGNIGGAVFMNAGTGTKWIDERVREVEVISLHGPGRIIAGDALKFEYRKQLFLQDGEIIAAAIFELESEDPELIKQRLVEAIQKRKKAQPIELPSCGSVFRNPPGKNAWKLVEEVGLKGFRKGGACFSPKHSNFIVNDQGATKADVLFLIQMAKEKVYDQFGIQLHEEVILMQPKAL